MFEPVIEPNLNEEEAAIDDMFKEIVRKEAQRAQPESETTPGSTIRLKKRAKDVGNDENTDSEDNKAQLLRE